MSQISAKNILDLQNFCKYKDFFHFLAQATLLRFSCINIGFFVELKHELLIYRDFF